MKPPPSPMRRFLLLLLVAAVLVAELEDTGVRDTTTILLTSDHGGSGKTHVPDGARSRHILWILNGPGVRKGFDLSGLANLTINTEDTFATACEVLKIRPTEKIDGRPVLEAVEKVDLLKSLAAEARAR